jgi:hypothetical protein
MKVFVIEQSQSIYHEGHEEHEVFNVLNERDYVLRVLCGK